LTGHYTNAIETLGNADGGALALFYQGKCHYALGAYDTAIQSYNSAQAAGYNGDLCQLAVAACKRQQKDIEGAMAIVDNMFGPIEQTAEYLSHWKTIDVATTKKQSNSTNAPQPFSRPMLERC